MVVMTFRGLLIDGAKDRLSLGTIKGKMGYRVIKLQILRQVPTGSIDHVVKILKSEPSSVPDSGATIDLSDGDLLAVAALSGTAFGNYDTTVIFDQEVFNQDIFVTHTDNDGSEACNYFIELEAFPLASDEATVATLKDIKLNA